MDGEVPGWKDDGDEGIRSDEDHPNPGCAFLIVDSLVKAALIGFFYILFATIRVQLGI